MSSSPLTTRIVRPPSLERTAEGVERAPEPSSDMATAPGIEPARWIRGVRLSRLAGCLELGVRTDGCATGGRRIALRRPKAEGEQSHVVLRPRRDDLGD